MVTGSWREMTMGEHCQTRGHKLTVFSLLLMVVGEALKLVHHGHGVGELYPLYKTRKRPLAYRDPAVNRGPPQPAQAKSVSGPRPKGH